jgi:phosphatidylglycerophosphate synthase
MAELRTRVHKQRHQEIGNWLARRVARPSAVYGTWAALRLGLSAHQVTLGSIVAGSLAAVAIATGERFGFVLGVALAHLAFWLDHVDGQVARFRGTASLDGVYLDYLMHHASGLFLGFGLGYGLAIKTGDTTWTLAGFAIACGWTFLNLQNDCRYKAFFQRLKASSATYRVEGGAGGKPSPPMPWPRRGRAMLTWPAYKACEPHVVLLALSALAVLALAWPEAWLISWRGGVRMMSVLAPLLAVGRIARGVSNHAVEAEFDRWFRPVEPVQEPSTFQTNSSS